MAEEKKTETPPSEDKGGLTVGELRKMITDTVAQLVGGNGEKKEEEKTTDRPSGNGIAAEVARQVEKIRAKEARDARDADIDKKLGELAEKTKPVENAPIERSRVHRFMGWGD